MHATMPFPLTIADTTVATPTELMQRVLTALTDDTGSDTAEWLIGLHPGQLDAAELTALAAALTTRPEPPALRAAAQLALHLNDERLGALLLQACLGVDLGTLLTPASPASDESIEDVLLHAIAHTAQLDAPDVRSRLLERLRGAGHSQRELAILVDHGDPLEIAEALPGLLAEGIQPTPTQRDRLIQRTHDDLDHAMPIQSLLATKD